MSKITLSAEQDGSGYFYGQYIAGDTHVRIDVLPPRIHPRPYFVVTMPAAQHDTEWIVYADGEEIARLTRREDLDTLDLQKLLPSE